MQNNQALRYIAGFADTESVEFLTLDRNPRLTHIVGLERLNSITNSLQILNNEELRDLSMLTRITSIHEVRIISNPFLEDLDGLRSLESARYLKIFGNHDLGGYNLLPSLRRVEDTLHVINNQKLCTENIEILLEQLETQPQETVIRDNPSCP